MATDPAVDDYLAEAPEPHREALEDLRALVHEVFPDAEESIQYGMPTFDVREHTVSIASQKRHAAFYTCETGDLERYADDLSGVDCGKGCIRFRNRDELPLDVVRHILEDHA